SRRSEDCLYSEADRRTLHAAGLALSHQELRRRDEMLLFYQAVTRSRTKLTLSYSQVDLEGHRVYASPYVTLLGELFDPAIEPKAEGKLDPLPAPDRILTAADLRLAAVQRAREKSCGWLKRLLDDEATQPAAWNVLAAADTAVRRFHTHGFTPFE